MNSKQLAFSSSTRFMTFGTCIKYAAIVLLISACQQKSHQAQEPVQAKTKLDTIRK
ncbi:MAG: hypothetical protein Q9M92_04125 [Enterobacterales bacterium]|nr:hypothetical protein [Enterobacterales bacterium]